MYLSVLPFGKSIEEIYQSIQGWDTVPELKNVKKESRRSIQRNQRNN